MKYQSELIKEIVESRGHKMSSIHYESECVESWIEEAKGAYPKLCDYESEWLNYISMLDDTGGSEKPEPPIGEFPYVVLSDVTEATVNHVVPLAYKSAILKGQTLVNLLDMNNLNQNSITCVVPLTTAKSEITIIATNKTANKSPRISLYNEGGQWVRNVNTSFTNNKIHYKAESGLYVTYLVFTTNNIASDSYSFESLEQFREQGFIVIEGNYEKDVPSYFEGMQPVQMPVLTTSNEDGTKTNILTVNEEVTLHGIGNVRDELDCLTGELTQRIGEMLLDGSENYLVHTTGNEFMRFKLVVKSSDAKRWGKCVSNNFAYNQKILSSSNDLEICCGDSANEMFLFNIHKSHLSTNDVTGFKNWLSQNNTIIHYELSNNTVKTVDLSIQDQDGKTLSKIKPIEGTMVLSTSSDTINPLFSGEIPVEAITQNLASFIDLETEE